MGRDGKLWYSDEDEEQCDQFWVDFSDKSGLHLRWTQAARGTSQIASQNGKVLAQVLGVTLFPRASKPQPARRVTVDGTTYSIICRLSNIRARAPDRTAVISFRGRHFNGDSRAVAHLSSGRVLRFPVRGTSPTNAVMSAIDGDWRPVFGLRKVKSASRDDNAVEIRIEPTEEPTPELLLAVAIAYHNLDAFFLTPADGGYDGGAA